MENADRVLNIEATFDWDDVGSWISIAKYLEKYGDENRANEPITEIDSQNNIVFNARPGTRIALLGVDDLIIVQTAGRPAHRQPPPGGCHQETLRHPPGRAALTTGARNLFRPSSPGPRDSSRLSFIHFSHPPSTPNLINSPHPALGIDYGDARIGIAATDDFGILAHPVETIDRARATPSSASPG